MFKSRSMRTFLFIDVLVFFLMPVFFVMTAFLANYVIADADLVPVPPLTNHIVDTTLTLSPDQFARLDNRLRDFEQSKGSQIAVLIIPSTQPETIEQYSIRVADEWKLGRKKIDDGVVLVVAKNDKTLRIEVGYGLEGALNDATSKRIIEGFILPFFRQGDFYGGINAGIEKIISIVEGEALPEVDQSEWSGESANFKKMLIVSLMAAIFLGGLFRMIFGPMLGAILIGSIIGFFAWFLVGALVSAIIAGMLAFIFTLISAREIGGIYMGRGGFGGGGFGGGLGGGGGGFGGGGASGRW